MKINLALQGGGSHGAFTWGVLDRLLEEKNLEVDGISGTSAGAMNAVVLAYGLSTGGAVVARGKLAEFWHEVSDTGKYGLFKPSKLDKMFSVGNMDFSPQYKFFESMAKIVPPSKLNLMNINPLDGILTKIVDFDKLREDNVCKLFIAATNVKTGLLRVFKNNEIGVDVVLASACLPFIFKAVEINGEHYWDGGYTANPTLFPLIADTDSSDIVVVQIEPTNIKNVPSDGREIMDRISSLSFNSNLMTEIRAINLMNQRNENKQTYLHSIDAESFVQDLHASSKLNTDKDFIQYLFESGRTAADDFLVNHSYRLGRESSMVIAK